MACRTRALALAVATTLASIVAGAACVKGMANQAAQGAAEGLAASSRRAAERARRQAAATVPPRDSAGRPVPAHRRTPSGIIATNVAASGLDVVFDREEEFARLVAAASRAATDSALDELDAELGLSLDDELASDGSLARAIATAAGAASAASLEVATRQVHDALVAGCPAGASARECLRHEARLLSGEVVAGALDRLRGPLIALAVAFGLLGALALAVVAFLVIRLSGPRARRPPPSRGRPVTPPAVASSAPRSG